MRNRLKVMVLGVLLLLPELCLAGCVTYKVGAEFSGTRDVVLKQDTRVDTGQSAAYAGGRIYYVSRESGNDGIHSMNPDGTDVRFVCSVPKITRLIAREGHLYYVGVREIFRGVKLYGLFRYDYESSATEEIQYTDSMSSVYDAYVAEDGTAYVLELGNIPAPYVPRKLLYICPPPEDIAAQTVMTYGSDKCEVWSDARIICVHEDSIHEDNNPEIEHANFIDEGPFSFLEASTGTALMDNLEEAYSVRYFKALLKQGGVIWCAMDNALLKLDADTADIIGQYAFGDAVSDMKPAYLYMDEDAAYVVFEGDGGALLYGFDPANGEYREIAAFDSKKVLLHITDGRIYRAQGREIICSALDEMGIAGDIFRIKLPRNIVADNIFETAGDWLFVYRDSPKANTETNRLLYKINLNTQAVIAADE